MRGGEGAVEAAEADEVVLGDGGVEGAALGVGEDALGVDGESLVEPSGQVAEAVVGDLCDEQVGEFVGYARRGGGRRRRGLR